MGCWLLKGTVTSPKLSSTLAGVKKVLILNYVQPKNGDPISSTNPQGGCRISLPAPWAEMDLLNPGFNARDK